MKFTPVFPAVVEFPVAIGQHHQKRPTSSSKQILTLISEAKRPGSVRGRRHHFGRAHADLKAFAEKTNISGRDHADGCRSFPETHPFSMKWFGMHGSLMAIGPSINRTCYCAIRRAFRRSHHGQCEKFATGAKIVHIDIDTRTQQE